MDRNFLNFKERVRKTKMLEYFKLILEKVSFDPQLFEKELRKSLQNLITEEVEELKSWCYQNFAPKYEHVLQQCFA